MPHEETADTPSLHGLEPGLVPRTDTRGQTTLHLSPCYTTSPAPVSAFWLVRVVGCVPLLAVLASVFTLHNLRTTLTNPSMECNGSLSPCSPTRSCPASTLCTLPANAKRSPSR